MFFPNLSIVIEVYLIAKWAKGLSSYTMRNYRADLKRFITWLQDPPINTVTSRRPIAKRDKAIILLLVDAGLRTSELSDLKVGEVDFKASGFQKKHTAKRFCNPSLVPGSMGFPV